MNIIIQYAKIEPQESQTVHHIPPPCDILIVYLFIVCFVKIYQFIYLLSAL